MFTKNHYVAFETNAALVPKLLSKGVRSISVAVRESCDHRYLFSAIASSMKRDACLITKRSAGLPFLFLINLSFLHFFSLPRDIRSGDRWPTKRAERGESAKHLHNNRLIRSVAGAKQSIRNDGKGHSAIAFTIPRSPRVNLETVRDGKCIGPRKSRRFFSSRVSFSLSPRPPSFFTFSNRVFAVSRAWKDSLFLAERRIKSSENCCLLLDR